MNTKEELEAIGRVAPENVRNVLLTPYIIGREAMRVFGVQPQDLLLSLDDFSEKFFAKAAELRNK